MFDMRVVVFLLSYRWNTRISTFWAALGSVPSYWGPRAPWHANTGPHEPQKDDSVEAREWEKLELWSRASHSRKLPVGSGIEQALTRPRFISPEGHTIHLSPLEDIRKHAIQADWSKEWNSSLEDLGLIQRKLGSIQVSSKLLQSLLDRSKLRLDQSKFQKFHQSILDRSKEKLDRSNFTKFSQQHFWIDPKQSWIDPTLDETSPEQFGSIQTHLGSIQVPPDSQFNSLYVLAIYGNFLCFVRALWDIL